jgi:glycosyltransferase involved in cell wall biosynthesis
MRTCTLTYSFYEEDSRVLRYTEALAGRGDHVDVIALQRPGCRPYEVINGVHVHRIQKREINEKGRFSYLTRILRFLLISAWWVSRLESNGHYDLVHVHSVPDFEVFAALVPKVFGAKIILDIHDIVPEFFASKFSNGRRSGVFNLLVLAERLSINFSDHVIISNDIWKTKLEGRSARAGCCTSMINYPDSSIFYKRPRARDDGRFMMVYPGTLNRHQGLDIAVHAFNLVKDRCPQAFLVIYGEGPARAELERQIDDLNLKGRVVLKPTIPLRQIAEVIADADVGVIPKRNDSFGGEAFSTKTLEFMASGVPVIVSRTRIDQYYFDDSLVRFFEPGNVDDLAAAMLAMIEDKAMRDRLAANGMAFAHRNTWDVKKNMYLDLVDGLCGRSDKGPDARGLRSEV